MDDHSGAVVPQQTAEAARVQVEVEPDPARLRTDGATDMSVGDTARPTALRAGWRAEHEPARRAARVQSARALLKRAPGAVENSACGESRL